MLFWWWQRIFLTKSHSSGILAILTKKAILVVTEEILVEEAKLVAEGKILSVKEMEE